MSVRLDEYCETSQSKFADALRVALKDVVFIGSDEIEFVENGDKVKADIKIMYSLTMFDVKHLLDVFRDFFWSIEPINDTYTYRIVVNLKKGML